MMRKKIISGKIKRSPDGFGFLIPDSPDHPDVYIPRSSMDGIMTSDRVTAQVEPETGGNRFRGEIIRVTQRGLTKIVGQFFKVSNQWGLIKDESKGWGQDLRIKMEDAMNASDGELVSAQILSYPGEPKGFQGKVLEIVGQTQNPLNDIKRVLLVNNISHEFSPAVLQETKQFKESVSEAEMKNRRNLRSLKFVTIDGATAKDFDDAVYVETNNKGFQLYVAIADVSHYVSLSSAIDKEAYDRGTSVYYPNYVVPMLPEVLSNGLCSLNPHVPRLALVAEMQLDSQGIIVKSQFYEAVIESKARMTYGEAQELIEGKPLEKFKTLGAEIRRASDLAKILMAKRFRDGSLDLEIPETQMVIDAGGVPVDIIRAERLFAHKLIEELMLIANVCVAEFLASRHIPSLYRIHESPNPEALSVLERYLETFGGKKKLKNAKLQKQLTQALQEFAGKPESLVLNILTLRSMAQARYSINNVGHFGLGFQNYTHFTSPIRRYPDLIVHRLIKNQIMPRSKYRLMSENDLASACTVLSAAEQRAVKSERQLTSIKKARFMEKHIGEKLDGMISSVVKFGLFVLLREFEVDGLIRMENLGSGYEYDGEHLCLVNKRSGHSYRVGDFVSIIVDSVDIDAGQINFILPSNKSSRSSPRQKRSLTKGKTRPRIQDKPSKKRSPHSKESHRKRQE